MRPYDETVYGQGKWSAHLHRMSRSGGELIHMYVGFYEAKDEVVGRNLSQLLTTQHYDQVHPH